MPQANDLMPRYQLQAYVFDSGAVARFEPHGWNTAGHILIHAPRAVKHIVVKAHSCFEVWDTVLPSYLMGMSPPPPVTSYYHDLDQALMAVVLKGD